MPLIDAVKKVCARLGPKGWTPLLKHHGLDLGAAKLETELARSLPKIDRTMTGFEDFALEGTRGVEPRKPARSLLYHAFASPNVVAKTLRDYPTLSEIEAVEDYVYGVQPPSIPELRSLADGRHLAVAVFATEYRPAHETVHRLHADVCFSRSGIARVGNKAARYDAERRGFLPFIKGTDKPHEIRVLPARYAAYVAVQRKGVATAYGPMNPQPGDEELNFWIPVHKLFPGTECVLDLDLTLQWDVNHVNEKLRRIHVVTEGKWGHKGPKLDEEPFVLRKGLAELSRDRDDGTGLLIPVPHQLVEEARYKGKALTFNVPASVNTFSSSVYIEEVGQRRKAPEFVHARHAVVGGKVSNLNDVPDVAKAVMNGGYRAKHYVDYTADGWLEVLCPEIGPSIPRRVPAYSLITAPDFFVNTDQRELAEWTEQSVRTELRKSLWGVPPDTLNDLRLPPNLGITNRFVKEDKTVTAIVVLPREGSAQATHGPLPNTQRHAHLPDAAAGVFDPGWDVSRDTTEGTPHLAMHGLGSPFPEDAKLCAALSTFWPAVAPDTTRVFQPNVLDTSPTVAPLTDAEIGIGGLAWDGTAPPKIRKVNGVDVVEYASFDHTDYVEAALNKKFSLQATGAVETREYEARVLAMARAFRALGITSDNRQTQIRQKSFWSVLSFTRLERRTSELRQAETASGTACTLPVYRFDMYQHGKAAAAPNDFRKIHVPVRERALLFVDALHVLTKRGAQAWRGVTDA